MLKTVCVSISTAKGCFETFSMTLHQSHCYVPRICSFIGKNEPTWQIASTTIWRHNTLHKQASFRRLRHLTGPDDYMANELIGIRRPRVMSRGLPKWLIWLSCEYINKSQRLSDIFIRQSYHITSEHMSPDSCTTPMPATIKASSFAKESAEP